MEIKPLQTLLVLVVFGALMGLAIYGGIQASVVEGPSNLRMDRKGELHVGIGQRIFVYDQASQLRGSYSLDQFGIDGLLGSFDFFSDNSLLLVADQADKASGSDQVPAGRLLRCYRDTFECRQLPNSRLSFQRTFRVAVSPSDQVYLADTSRGTVYRLDAEGEQRDKLAGELDRPNQLRLIDDHLVIAHTEGEELIKVPLSEGLFGTPEYWQRIAITSDQNRSRRETRPLDFLYTNGLWYVLAKPVSMRSGTVYRYDDDGQYHSQFSLPPGADPMALARLGDDLLVADWAGHKIHRFNLDGELQGELVSPEQRAYLDSLLERQRNFRILEITAWALFAAALVIGFAVAIRAELKKAKQKREARPDQADTGFRDPTSRPHPMEARIHWLQPKKTVFWLCLLVVAMTLVMPLVVGTVFPTSEDPEEACVRYGLGIVMWSLTGVMLLVFIPLLFKLRQVVSTRIGVCDEWVLVDCGNGVVHAARDEELIEVNNGFIIDLVTVPIGNTRMPLYNRRELEQWLKPRLDRGRKLGPLEQVSWQWQHKRGLLMLAAAAVIVGLVLLVMLETGVFEQRFEQWLKQQPACQQAEAQDMHYSTVMVIFSETTGGSWGMWL